MAGINVLNLKLHCAAFPILLRGPSAGPLLLIDYNKPALRAALSKPL